MVFILTEVLYSRSICHVEFDSHRIHNYAKETNQKQPIATTNMARLWKWHTLCKPAVNMEYNSHYQLRSMEWSLT